MASCLHGALYYAAPRMDWFTRSDMYIQSLANFAGLLIFGIQANRPLAWPSPYFSHHTLINIIYIVLWPSSSHFRQDSASSISWSLLLCMFFTRASADICDQTSRRSWQHNIHTWASVCFLTLPFKWAIFAMKCCLFRYAQTRRTSCLSFIGFISCCTSHQMQHAQHQTSISHTTISQQ